MFETMERLYKAGKLTDEQLHHAVEKGWITAEQSEEIRGMQDTDNR